MQSYMKTLEILLAPNMRILLVEDSRVKTLALLEEVKGLKEKEAVYGKKCVALYGRLDLNTSSLRTAQLSLFEDSKPYYATLPKRGIMLNGDVYQILSSDSRTKEKGSILLPTPTKSNDKRGGYKDPEKLRAYLSKYQNCVVDILSLKGFTKCQILKLLESMMGFPIGATELER